MGRLQVYEPYVRAHPKFHRPFGSNVRQGDLEALLQEQFPATTLRSTDVWTSYTPDGHLLPPHGWKVHIAATPHNIRDILGIVIGAAQDLALAFKSVRATDFAYAALSRWWPATQVGKLITVYPRDVDRAAEALTYLHGRTQSYVGTYILTDRRYKDSLCLYYRYGAFTGQDRVLPDGTHERVLFKEGYEPWADRRAVGWRVPPWAIDEDTEWYSGGEGGEGSGSSIVTLGEYTVMRVLKSGGTGGTYEAIHTHTRLPVILKEARCYTGFDELGQDAQDRLRAEYATLVQLRDSGIAPHPYALFEHWRNLYLAEELIPGLPLVQFVAQHNPLVRNEGGVEEYDNYRELMGHVTSQIRGAIDECHRRGIIYGDLSATNVMVDPDTRAVRLVDFGLARPQHLPARTRMGTPGFMPPPEWVGQVDEFGLAACQVALLLTRNTLVEVSPPALDTSVGFAERCLGTSIADARKVMGISQSEFRMVSVDQIIEDGASYIVRAFDSTDERCYIPADPTVYETNPYSLMYGLAGPAMLLAKLQTSGWERLLDPFGRIEAGKEDLPAGLFYGTAGIALALGECGVIPMASRLMEALRKRLMTQEVWDADLATGVAGIGLSALRLFILTEDELFLDVGKACLARLAVVEVDNGRGLVWNTKETRRPYQPLGWALGSSGVAQFLFWLARILGDDGILRRGLRGLEHDLSYLAVAPDGVLGFPARAGSEIYTPYLLGGAAGLGLVASRYARMIPSTGLDQVVDTLAREITGGVAINSGLLRGEAGLLEFVMEISDRAQIVAQGTERMIDAIRSLACQERDGIVFPGDALSRLSCDLASGSAGVLLVLSDFRRGVVNPLVSPGADVEGAYAKR